MQFVKFIFAVVLISFFEIAFSQKIKVASFTQFELLAKSNIRAIEVINDSTVWFAGSKGVYGFTNNGGLTFMIDTLRTDSTSNELRSIALPDEQTILLMNAGSPAFIRKSNDMGATWKTVYENRDSAIFFDALKFSDNKNGIAIGDPIHNCFQILITNDGGETWQLQPCKNIPASLAGEACFASSNSCITIENKNVWFGTGGMHARVFSSGDFGIHWLVTESPIVTGNTLTGIFTIDFADDRNGIAGGGDYENPTSVKSTVAITKNGGKTWKSIAEKKPPPMISCIKYSPSFSKKVILAACLSGIYSSNNKGKKWSAVADEKGNAIKYSYYVLGYSPSGKVAWFAGANGHFAKLTFK